MKNILKASLPAAIAAALVGAPSVAAAGPLDFDRDSFFIVSAERMFGFSYSQTKSELTVGNQTSTSTTKRSHISLLGGNGNTYNTPLVGLHYSVIPALTLGAGIGFSRTSGTITQEGSGQSKDTDIDPTTTILLAPRVGYIIGFSNAFFLWARGGITYVNSSNTSESTNGTATTKTENSESHVALSLDPMFVVTPVNRFGFMFGPVLDFDLSGKTKSDTTTGSTTTSNEITNKITNFGLQVGLVGYLLAAARGGAGGGLRAARRGALRSSRPSQGQGEPRGAGS